MSNLQSLRIPCYNYKRLHIGDSLAIFYTQGLVHAICHLCTCTNYGLIATQGVWPLSNARIMAANLWWPRRSL